MSKKPRNLLFIMSDEHSKRVLGCNGNPLIRTPNLDRLAAGGVHFTDAYCNSPICVPSRASFQTGRYVHDIRFWDRQSLRRQRAVLGAPLGVCWHRVDSIGKLHFRSADDDNGFSTSTCRPRGGGIGDPIDVARSATAAKGRVAARFDAGCGDPLIKAMTIALRRLLRTGCASAAHRRTTSPDTLRVVCLPHFPMLDPSGTTSSWRTRCLAGSMPSPSGLTILTQAMRACQIYDQGFDDPARAAIAAYYGLVVSSTTTWGG